MENIHNEDLIDLLLKITESDKIHGLNKKHRNALEERWRNLSVYSTYYLISGYGLYWLVITNEDAYRNWNYYAGFEYIDDHNINKIKIGDDFIYFVSEEADERVSEVMEIIRDVNDRITMNVD